MQERAGPPCFGDLQPVRSFARTSATRAMCATAGSRQQTTLAGAAKRLNGSPAVAAPGSSRVRKPPPNFRMLRFGAETPLPILEIVRCVGSRRVRLEGHVTDAALLTYGPRRPLSRAAGPGARQALSTRLWCNLRADGRARDSHDRPTAFRRDSATAREGAHDAPVGSLVGDAGCSELSGRARGEQGTRQRDATL